MKKIPKIELSINMKKCATMADPVGERLRNMSALDGWSDLLSGHHNVSKQERRMISSKELGKGAKNI